MSIYRINHFKTLEEIPESLFLFLNQNPLSNYETLQSLEELKKNPGKYGNLLECLTVERNDTILVATFRVPSYNVLISHAHDLNAVTAIVEYMGQKNIIIPGIFGLSEVSNLFVKEWETLYSDRFQTSNDSWFLLLEHLYKLPKNIGKIHIASRVHEDMLLRWSEASILELIPNSPKSFLESCKKNVSRRIQDNKVFILLVNDKVVSMGSITGRYRDLQFINDVYTPPEYRCKGYATELCIELVQTIRRNNKRPVLTVFVTNEKAIRIYTKIGFKQKFKVALYLKQN